MNKFTQALLVVSLLLAGCAEETAPPPVMEVVIDRASLAPYKPQSDFVGRLQAEDDVNIQAKVSGYLLSRNFQEGDFVEAGTLLYQIDPDQFQAELAKAKANLAKARAALDVAERNFKRGKELLPRGAISESEFDRLTASKLEAEAELKSAQAQITAAEVNLGYTNIHAPISGRIGASEFSTGDLIGPESGTLTTLVSIDPMKATFQVSEQAFLATDARKREMEEQGVDIPQLEIHVELSNRQLYPLGGYIDYVANRVDENTGTIEARASIPNPHGELRPGQYVKVLVELPMAIDTLMIPQAAVQADQQGSFVLVVGPDNIVKRQNVELDDRVKDKVVVKQGLEEGDRVIVRGLQKVRPGQPVKTKEMPSADTAKEA